MNDDRMESYLEEAADHIDAGIFSGDDFKDPGHRRRLRALMKRWERGLKEWDKYKEDDE